LSLSSFFVRVGLVRVDPADVLRERGLRVTAQRVAVLRAVSGEPHVTADAVAERVRAGIGAISVQAVYDALGVLVDANLVRRIEPSGSPARFEARVDDNHHHAICRLCGRVADVDCAVGSAPCLTAVDDIGYQIDEAEVIYWGRCPECVGASSVPSDGHERLRSVRRPAGHRSLGSRAANVASEQRPEGTGEKRKERRD
jgi:Fe2+ or Zn2+ uptake regulation protein